MTCPTTGRTRAPYGWPARLLTAVCTGALLFSLGGCAAYWANERVSSLLDAGNYEEALTELEAAVAKHPDSQDIRRNWLRARTEVVTRLQAQASALRARSDLDAAEEALRRASRLDPHNARVRDMLQALSVERRQQEALTEASALTAQGKSAAALRRVLEALKANPRHPGLLDLQRRLELEQRRLALQAGPGLAEVRPITLDFRDAGLRTVLDLVTRHSGVNFVLDKDIRPELRVTVYLKNVKVEDALDLIVSTHQLAKKVLDDRTILIYPNVPDKHREHQEQVVKVFYLTSGDVKQAATLLKSVLRVKDPFVDERSNMLVLREAPDTVLLAERLIALYDAGEPEVVLELEVLEINSTRLTELGVKFPDTLALTPLAAAGATGLTVAGLRELGSDRIGVSVAGLLLNLRRQVGDFQTLANPRVRIKNREKAKVLVGSKLPVVTTTATTGFIAESITYLDVGLKLDLEPTVSIDDEVSIRVALEVSTPSSETKTSSGTRAFAIGTRSASTVLRLRDGETQVLAGLVSKEERSSSSRIPGLGDLPVLGRLFANQLDDGTRTEVLLAMTPRIVRNLRRPEASESELWIGTDAYLRLRPPGGRASTQPTDVTQAPGPTAMVPSSPGAAPRPASPAEPEAAPSLSLSWRLPPNVKAGEAFVAELWADAQQPMRGMNLRLAVDAQAAVLDGRPGAWWGAEDQQLSVTQALDSQKGEWQFGVIKRSAAGLKGEGPVLSLRLRAHKPGPMEWRLLSLTPIAAGPDAPRPGTALPSLKVNVQP